MAGNVGAMLTELIALFRLKPTAHLAPAAEAAGAVAGVGVKADGSMVRGDTGVAIATGGGGLVSSTAYADAAALEVAFPAAANAGKLGLVGASAPYTIYAATVGAWAAAGPGGGASAFTDLTDKTTVDMAAINTPLAADFAEKADLFAAMDVTAGTTLTASHINRQLRYTSAGSGDLTIASGIAAAAHWFSVVVPDTNPTGVPTLITPDSPAKSVTGSISKSILAEFKGIGNGYTVGTTDPAAAGMDAWTAICDRFESGYGFAAPNGGTSSYQGVGHGTGAIVDSSAAATATMAGTNPTTATNRIQYTTAATTNRLAGIQFSTGTYARMDSPGGPKCIALCGGIEDTSPTLGQMSLAFGSDGGLAVAVGAEPSASALQQVALILDSPGTDTNVQVFFKGAHATPTKFDMGPDWARAGLGKTLITAAWFVSSDNLTHTIRAKNHNTKVTYVRSFTAAGDFGGDATKLPSISTLRFCQQIIRGNKGEAVNLIACASTVSRGLPV